jgi:hypothetical protein
MGRFRRPHGRFLSPKSRFDRMSKQRSQRLEVAIFREETTTNTASSLAGSVLRAFSSRVCRSPGISGKFPIVWPTFEEKI